MFSYVHYSYNIHILGFNLKKKFPILSSMFNKDGMKTNPGNVTLWIEIISINRFWFHSPIANTIWYQIQKMLTVAVFLSQTPPSISASSCVAHSLPSTSGLNAKQTATQPRKPKMKKIVIIKDRSIGNLIYIGY